MSTPSSVIYDASNNVINNSDLIDAVHQAGYGTSTQVYTSNGPGVKPTFQTAGIGTGGMVWLGTATASVSATVNFDNKLSATYDNYYVVVENCISSAGTQTLICQVGTGGTPTYSATTYLGVSQSVDGAPTTSTVATGTNGFELTGGILMSAAATRAGAFTILVTNANSSNDKVSIAMGGYWGQTNTRDTMSNVRSRWQSATVLTSLRFQFNSGNITSGIFKLYGLVN